MAQHRHDLTGKRFDRLTVTRMDFGSHPSRCYVRCDCGTEKWVRSNNLLVKNPKKQTRSCGCLKKERLGSRPRRDEEKENKAATE